MQEPKHDLKKVKEICELALSDDAKEMARLVNFIAPTRSLNCIVAIIGCEAHEAAEICLKGILKLQPEDFSHRTIQWEDSSCIADVYGLQNYEFHDWYVKFSLYEEDNELKFEEISFHQPKLDLKLKDGRIIKGVEK